MRSRSKACKVWMTCLSSPLQGTYLCSGLLFKVKVKVQTQLCFSQLFWNKGFWRAEALDWIYPPRLLHWMGWPNVMRLYRRKHCSVSVSWSDIIWRRGTRFRWRSNICNIWSIFFDPSRCQRRDVTGYLLQSKPVNHRPQWGGSTVCVLMRFNPNIVIISAIQQSCIAKTSNWLPNNHWLKALWRVFEHLWRHREMILWVGLHNQQLATIKCQEVWRCAKKGK